ncbi:hypothetical protein KDK_35540 [Dictyobacter kobayashii]|uniref:Uncharacterized protein n=1 Tax=Dictyobacter kobayashii TaxID=2014872 RepID=A0A402AL56_9CHLR|nr:hypothetical protein KDK_35540 [Dictyobacter kobayashii]
MTALWTETWTIVCHKILLSESTQVERMLLIYPSLFVGTASKNFIPLDLNNELKLPA